MTTLALDTAAPSLGRLTLVELRKMADTRAGRWLLISVGLIAAALVTIRIFAGAEDSRTLDEFFSFALVGVSILTPVLGILAVTSEWNQRTALTTFALVPQRERVLAAKLLAALLVAVASVVASLVFAVAANGVTELLGRGGGWDVGFAAIVYAVLYEALSMLMGVAFGALFLASGPAIVVYFVLPTVWAILGQSISWLRHADGWLDFGTTSNMLLTSHVSAEDWAKLTVSTLLWVILPLAVGAHRVVRREVK
jgi:ABC-2 type transport system permease protein